MNLSELPDDKESLHALVRLLVKDRDEQATELLAAHSSLKKKDESISSLNERIATLEQYLFGSRSEKRKKFDAITEEQSLLFNEPESAQYDGKEPEKEKGLFTEVRSHQRKRGGRSPLPAHLLRKEIIHDLSEEEKVCPHGHTLSRIGQEVTEKLSIIPAKAYVERHIRPKYTCKHCEEERANIKIAPLPKMLLPKAVPSADFMAYAVSHKFADRTPYYHLAKIFGRVEIDISREDLSRWTIKIFLLHLKVPLHRLLEELFRSGYLQIDETTLQVLREENRSNTTKSFMFAIHGEIRGRPVAMFHYEPTRSARWLEQWMKDFKGIAQTDGFGSYDYLFERLPGVIHAGCNTHARRGFVKCHGVKDAQYVIDEYSKIYAIESEMDEKNATLAERHDARQSRSKAIMEGLRKKMDEWYPQYTGAGDMGKAIRYFIGQYEKLCVFLDHPEIRPDTNLVENDIRPLAVGRKNWTFAGSPAGADASAALYSLVQTAQLNGWDPFFFLSDLFHAIESSHGLIDLVEFLATYRQV